MLNKKIIVFWIISLLVVVGGLLFLLYRTSCDIRFAKEQILERLNGLESLVLLEIENQTKMLQETSEELSDSIEKQLLERLNGLESLVLLEIENQTKMLQETSEELSGNIEDTIDLTANETRKRISDTNMRIQRLELLLEGQKQQVVESPFTTDQTAEWMRRGLELMKNKRYYQAREIFSIVSNAEPQNNEARFYNLYTLFMSNPIDHDEYPKIREGFAFLTYNGYSRREMTDVLNFIAAEEQSIAPTRGIQP